METIVVYPTDGVMLRCWGKRIDGRRIDLLLPLEGLEGDKVYPIELLDAKIRFMGWLSRDKSYIIKD